MLRYINQHYGEVLKEKKTEREELKHLRDKVPALEREVEMDMPEIEVSRLRLILVVDSLQHNGDE